MEVKQIKKEYKLKIKELKTEYKLLQIKLVEKIKQKFWNDIIFQIHQLDGVKFIGYVISPNIKFDLSGDFLKFEYLDLTFMMKANKEMLYIEKAFNSDGSIANELWHNRTGTDIKSLIKNINNKY